MQWRLYLNMQLKVIQTTSKHRIIRNKWIVSVFGSLHSFLLLIFHVIEWVSRKMKRITFCQNWTRKSYGVDSDHLELNKQTNKHSKIHSHFHPPLVYCIHAQHIYLSAIYFSTIKHNYSINDNYDKEKTTVAMKALLRYLVRIFNFELHSLSLSTSKLHSA